MSHAKRIRELILRLARLGASASWHDDLNPAQASALGYLARANRFSRAPSHVADYLGTTRGTMSQTLKALERKGYVTEARSEADKRSITFDLTEAGTMAAAQQGALERAIATLPRETQSELEEHLTSALIQLIEANGGRAFGVCRTCRHHQHSRGEHHCGLLNVVLSAEEPDQLCHEFA